MRQFATCRTPYDERLIQAKDWGVARVFFDLLESRRDSAACSTEKKT